MFGEEPLATTILYQANGHKQVRTNARSSTTKNSGVKFEKTLVHYLVG